MTLSRSPFIGFFSLPADVTGTTKPDFSTLPPQIRADLCTLAGASSITDAQIARGGVSASLALIVTFDTGLRLFIKGSHPNDQSHGAANVRGECMAYRSIDLLADIAPQFCGMVSLDAGDDNGWWLGAWQAVDVQTMTRYDVDAVFALINQVASHDVPAKRGLPVASAHPYLSQFMMDTYKWKRVVFDQTRAAQFAACFVDGEAALDWLHMNGAQLCDLQATAAQHSWRLGLIHGDARCDNFIYARTAAADAPRWYLVDWANAADGALAFDRVMLAASLCAEGALSGADALRLACTNLPLDDVQLMVAMQAGYFADQMYRTPVASMPRLRTLQRAMFWALGEMLAACTDIPAVPALKIS